MGGLSVLRGIVGGVAGAAGNTQLQDQEAHANQQAQQQKAEEQRAKIAPLALNVKNLKSGIENAYAAYQQQNPGVTFDQWKTGPGAQQFNRFADLTQYNVHSMREILHPDWTPGPMEWLKTHTTDRLHITNAAGREAGRANDAAWDKYNEGQIAGAQTGFQPGMAPAAKATTGTETERFIADYQKTHPGASMADALRAHTDATTKESDKAPKGLKPLEAGGVAYGVIDQDSGKQYLPSQLSGSGNAPPEAKQIWQSIQAAKAEKEAAETKKENERIQMQARTLGAAFERMGMAQQFQEQMAGYRSDLTTYRALDKQADDSEAQIQGLRDQYSQPGNHAVADNELQNFYTSVVQKGGRKTAAELKLTTQIGSFGMNLKQIADKAMTGELPDELRKELLSGMQAVAKEQRAAASAAKPELPQLPTPSGPKHKQVQGTRNTQTQGGKSLSDRLNEALQ